MYNLYRENIFLNLSIISICSKKAPGTLANSKAPKCLAEFLLISHWQFYTSIDLGITLRLVLKLLTLKIGTTVILLTWIWTRPVEPPFILTGQILTILYFFYYPITAFFSALWNYSLTLNFKRIKWQITFQLKCNCYLAMREKPN